MSIRAAVCRRLRWRRNLIPGMIAGQTSGGILQVTADGRPLAVWHGRPAARDMLMTSGQAATVCARPGASACCRPPHAGERRANLSRTPPAKETLYFGNAVEYWLALSAGGSLRADAPADAEPFSSRSAAVDISVEPGCHDPARRSRAAAPGVNAPTPASFRFYMPVHVPVAIHDDAISFIGRPRRMRERRKQKARRRRKVTILSPAAPAATPSQPPGNPPRLWPPAYQYGRQPALRPASTSVSMSPTIHEGGKVDMVHRGQFPKHSRERLPAIAFSRIMRAIYYIQQCRGAPAQQLRTQCVMYIVQHVRRKHAPRHTALIGHDGGMISAR